MDAIDIIDGMFADGVPHRLHSLGITGIGLSGVSALFKSRGWEVSGCDALPSPAISNWLNDHGIDVETGHDPFHIVSKMPDLVLRSPAVADNHPELIAARRNGIPVARRGEALAAIVNRSRTVAVCGTHGKTTTSCFVELLLHELDEKPAWCIGGYTESMGGVAGLGGTKSSPLVVEADESDGTLALYRPHITVMTCVEPDHMEHFASFGALKDCFASAVRNTSETVIYCADDANAAEIAQQSVARVYSYGFSSNSDFRCEIICLDAASSRFTITDRKSNTYEVTIGVPGRHNILNAVAAFTVGIALGHAPATVVAAMSALSELPGRRFEQYDLICGVRMVSDYSHHPTEIAALVATAKLSAPKHIVAVFQPHRYTRTLALGASFPHAFLGVDDLLLLPVYAASELPLFGGKSEDLYREFRMQNAKDASIPVPKLIDSVEAAKAYLETSLSEGDMLLVIGAGNVVALVPALLKSNVGTPVARQRVGTSFGVGGKADKITDVCDDTKLCDLLAQASQTGTKVRVIGQGTNVLVSDCGLRGNTLRLTGDRFCSVSRLDEVTLKVGCGMPGAGLLAKLRDSGLTGLEYMAGIPGCVGGWLAMNAGTRFGEFGDRVVEFTAVDMNGDISTVLKAEAGFGYRQCRALENAVALDVTIRLSPDDPAAIAGRMEDFRTKRFNFAGLRTAGSVFRNPEGTTAGKLLDEAGCKGLRVGGAFVSDRHANIIAAENGGTASDIIALSSLMHDKVLERFGIDLHREIRIW